MNTTLHIHISRCGATEEHAHNFIPPHHSHTHTHTGCNRVLGMAVKLCTPMDKKYACLPPAQTLLASGSLKIEMEVFIQ